VRDNGYIGHGRRNTINQTRSPLPAVDCARQVGTFRKSGEPFVSERTSDAEKNSPDEGCAPRRFRLSSFLFIALVSHRTAARNVTLRITAVNYVTKRQKERERERERSIRSNSVTFAPRILLVSKHATGKRTTSRSGSARRQ